MIVVAVDVGILHMAACAAEISDQEVCGRVLACDVLAIGQPKQPISELVDGALRVFESRSDLFCPPGLAKVVIEQQCAMASPKNYALAAAVYCHYVMRGVPDVKFVSPRHKFTALAAMFPSVSADDEPNLKKRSVKLAGLLAEQYPTQLSVFSLAYHSRDKKDDLSDVLGMCLTCTWQRKRKRGK